MIKQELYQEMCAAFFPVFRKFGTTEKYAITLGGSHGKGISDKKSDFDFRVYYEKGVPWETMKGLFDEVDALVKQWKSKGVEVDGVWPRSFEDVDKQLDQWLSGNAEPVHMEWNVWGYNMLTDIYNQQIVEDPYLKAQAWKDRLKVYPDALQNAILKKHLSSLRYWRADYHYRNKVDRQDHVFLASISARLTNDMMQALYAMNRFYFPGDGMNLKYAKDFKIKPERLEERLISALYPGQGGEVLKAQYDGMVSLIDDVLLLGRCAAVRSA